MFEQFFTPYQASSAITGNKVLILAPHPDDEIFGCGAAAANWAQQGVELKVLILTDGVVEGEFGDQPDAKRLRQEKAQHRANESKQAAQILGLPEPEFLHGQDGALWTDAAIKEKVLAIAKAWQPTTIVIPSVWEMHRDHRTTAEIGLELAQQLSSIEQVAMYEVGVPLTANTLEDITEMASLKWQAMQCFTSQLSSQRYAEQIQGLNQFRAYTLGLEISAAEAFHCINKADLDWFISQQQPQAASFALHQFEQTQAKYQQINAQQQSRIAELEQLLLATKQTLSWRITKPLRAFRGLLKRR